MSEFVFASGMVVVNPSYEAPSQAIRQLGRTISVPAYFWERWVWGAGGLSAVQQCAWLSLRARVLRAQFSAGDGESVRICLPLKDLGRDVGLSSRNAIRQHLVYPVRDRQPFSLFVLAADPIAPAQYARMLQGRVRGLLQNPGMVFTIAMDVPLHPGDVDEGVLDREASNPTVRFLSAAARGEAHDGSVPDLPGFDWSRIEARPAVDWDSYVREVLCPLLAAAGDRDPGAFLESREKMQEVRERFLALGWDEMLRVTRRIAPYLGGKKYPGSYFVKSLVRSYPQTSASTPVVRQSVSAAPCAAAPEGRTVGRYLHEKLDRVRDPGLSHRDVTDLLVAVSSFSTNMSLLPDEKAVAAEIARVASERLACAL